MSKPAQRVETLPAFRVLFRQHYAFVWRSLVHFGLRGSEADDAAQDVFMVVHRRLPDFDGRTHLRSWLFGIAYRVARGHQRGELRREKRLELVREPDPPLTPEEGLARGDALRLVDAFLSSLDPGQSDVFYLADIEGLTAPEIAGALGINLNTVYSRLRVARQHFERTVARQPAQQKGRRA